MRFRAVMLVTVATSVVLLFCLTGPTFAAAKNAKGWYWPVGSGVTGGYYGWQWTSRGFHLAQDFKARLGTPVVAISDGTVVKASMTVGGYGPGDKQGGAVVIRHETADGQAFLALYGHLKELAVGQKVRAGQLIGKIGPYSPTHLHVGIHPGPRPPTDAKGMWRGYTSKKSVLYGWVDPLLFLRTERAPSRSPAVNPAFTISRGNARVDSAVISGNTAVWCEYRSDRTDIFGYDIPTKTVFPICADAGYRDSPAVSGSTVVWADRRVGSSRIFGYDLATKTTFPIGNPFDWQGEPAVSGNIVVWIQARSQGEDSDIYAYDLTTKTEFPICTGPGAHSSPSISGNTVVWSDTRNGDWKIYGYDLFTGREFPVSTAGVKQSQPAISGNTVVWSDHRNDPGWGIDNADIYGCGLNASIDYPICTDGDNQAGPKTSGDWVVWCVFHNAAIRGYDLCTKTQFLIRGDLDPPGFPDISGNTVVWAEGSSRSIVGVTLER